MTRTIARVLGGAAIATLLMGAACPQIIDINDKCYPQIADRWGNCPEPGRDESPAQASEPAQAPAAPAPEPMQHDYPSKVTHVTD